MTHQALVACNYIESFNWNFMTFRFLLLSVEAFVVVNVTAVVKSKEVSLSVLTLKMSC